MEYKKFVRKELAALWKDFYIGITTFAFILVASIIIGAVIGLMDEITGLLFENTFLRIGTAIGFIIMVGILSRLLQKSKWFPFKKWIPKEFLNKPEVAWQSGDTLRLGILIQVHAVYGLTLGEVVPAQGGPTSAGHLSGTLVDTQDLYLTGRTYGQVIAACMSFGVKTTPIRTMEKFNCDKYKNASL